MTPPMQIRFPAYQFVPPQTSITNLTAVVGVPLPGAANALLVQAIGANVRITFDGQPPTSAHGFQIRAGDPPFLLVLFPGASFLAIQEAAGAALEVIGVSQPV